MLMSEKLKVCVRWFIYFLDLLWVRYNCAKFHHCRICVTDFRKELIPKKPIPKRVKDAILYGVFNAYNTLYILTYTCPHSTYLGRFRHIQNPTKVRLTHLFMYMKAYSKPMAYSAIFRTVDIFSQFQTLLKSNSCIFWRLFEQIQTYLVLWLI